MDLFINSGDQVDFTNSRLARRLQLSPTIAWNAGRHLELRLRQTLSSLETQAGEKIFDADLTDLRMTWQFSIRSFLRLTFQHQWVERDLRQFNTPTIDRETASLGTQLLYSYKLNPQTVLFAGYSDNQRDNDSLLGLTKSDRTFFMKFSYAWSP